MVGSLRGILWLGGLLLSGLMSGLVHAASAVLIWPINPVLESDQSATAVWLENRGQTTVSLQVRVLAWRQGDYQDEYTAQKDMVASPPFASIEPGKRQLVRLIRQGPQPEHAEDAYRILIDEVPSAAADASRPSGVGVQFQMRYSLPFFVTGPGVWTQPRSDKARDADTATQPQLSWQLTTVQGARYLEVHNTGDVHARLSQVRWLGGGTEVTLNKGLLGYVLAGQRMRWQLPSGVAPKAGMRLSVQLGDNTPPVDVPAR